MPSDSQILPGSCSSCHWLCMKTGTSMFEKPAFGARIFHLLFESSSNGFCSTSAGMK